MATIKELLQNFCYRMNLPAPTAFVGVSSPTERQYLSLFQFIGDGLRNRPVDWPQLKRNVTLLSVEDERKIQLPGDFYRILESCEWDIDNKWPLRGPISDYNFAVRELAVVSLQTRKAFRLIGAQNYIYSTSPYTQRSQGWFELDPAPDANDQEFYLGYISCNWVWPRDWVTNTGYSAGDIRTGNGYVYRTAAGGTSGSTRPNWSTGSDSDGAVTWAVYTEPYLCNPANSALNDNDLCLFDEDIMIEGMRWAYKKAKGLDYQQERLDWEQMVQAAVGRFNGPQRINAADEFGDYFDWPNCPQGSWNV